MQLLKSIAVILWELMAVFFSEGVPMLSQNLLDGMRAMPCLQHTVEFVMELSDALCYGIAACFGILTVVAFGVGMVGINTITISTKYGIGDRCFLIVSAILSAAFGFLCVVFLAVGIV